MSAISSVGAAAPQVSTPKPVSPKGPAKEGNSGPGAATLRHVPTVPVKGSVNLLV